jgi:pimeloyl-ACP methyl ester carboxylesterase
MEMSNSSSGARVLRDAACMDQFRRGELVFDVIDEGPADGPVAVLLHGFPQFNMGWNAVIARLAAKGYRCLAPNQRGYSPGARPTRRRDYRVSELVEDVRALIDASDAQRVHLVGHDFGATVAWAAAAEMPERLVSVVSLSTPHPAAFLKAMATSRQGIASWYIYLFQLPLIPERYFLRGGNAFGLSKLMHSYAEQPAEAAERDARAMAEPGVLTAALNWYRAIPMSLTRRVSGKITVPTMYIWSDGDKALLEKGARDTGRYVGGEYRFEILQGTHWLVDEQPDTVADLLLDWFAAHPI